jgi:hypothetical protein
MKNIRKSGFCSTKQGLGSMIEELMGYVDRLENLLFKEQTKNGTVDNERYMILMDLKKFVMDDLVYYFIDQDIREIKFMSPTRDMITNTMHRWSEFARKYPEYLNSKAIREYMIGQMLQDE